MHVEAFEKKLEQMRQTLHRAGRKRGWMIEKKKMVAAQPGNTEWAKHNHCLFLIEELQSEKDAQGDLFPETAVCQTYERLGYIEGMLFALDLPLLDENEGDNGSAETGPQLRFIEMLKQVN